MFRTKLVSGYCEAGGELYDPLVHGESNRHGRRRAHVGRGERAFGWTRNVRTVRYQLAEAMTSGEVSVEVEGLHPNGPNHKLKIFSMNSSDSDPSFSDNVHEPRCIAA